MPWEPSCKQQLGLSLSQVVLKPKERLFTMHALFFKSLKIPNFGWSHWKYNPGKTCVWHFSTITGVTANAQRALQIPAQQTTTLESKISKYYLCFPLKASV